MTREAFGRYRIVERLGAGGMGTVWRAEDTLLHRPVALKFLSESLIESAEARRRFLREARAASALDHPGIATVYDAGEVDGTPYLAGQLVPGVSIAQRLRESGPFPVEQALEIHRLASEALAHAHSRGVLHRDISSRNIMLTPEGRPVLVDFGLARRSDTTVLTQSGSPQGTVAYLAPEVLEGGEATEASDRYSLGVVLYEMLTGEVPFRGERVEAVMLKILGEPPAAPSTVRPGIPAAVDARIASLLAKDPGERPTPGGTASLTQRVLRAPRRLARVPARTWAAVLAVLVVVVAGALVAQRGGRSTTAPPKSIAVLPLENTSVDPEASDFLAEGIAQLVSAQLSQLGRLAVTPWVTSRRFRDLSALEVTGRTLGTEALLTGTYRQVGDRLQVTAILVDTRTGTQIWATSIEESASNLFDVQRAIASQVATELLGSLTPDDQVRLAVNPAQNVDAYTVYLRGAHSLQLGDVRSSDEASTLFEEALALDSTLADAHVGLGAVLTNKYFYFLGGGPELLTRAERHYHKALELDPGSIGARRGLVRVMWHRGNAPVIADIIRNLVAIDSVSIEARLTVGEALTLGLWPERAIYQFDQVLRTDPENVGAAWYRVVALTWSGQSESAVRAADEFLEKYGPDPEMFLWKAQALHGLGRMEEAGEAYEQALDGSSDITNGYVYFLAASYYRAIGDEANERLSLGLLEARLRPVHAASPGHGRAAAFLAIAQLRFGNDEPLSELLTTKSGLEGSLIRHWDLWVYTLEVCASVKRRDLVIELLESGRGDPLVYMRPFTIYAGPGIQALIQDPDLKPLIDEIRSRRNRLL